MNRNIPIVITGKVIDYLKDGNVKVELSNGQIITVSVDIISEYTNKTSHKEYSLKNIGDISIMNEYLYKPYCPDIIEIYDTEQIDYNIPQVAYSPVTDSYYYNYIAAQMEADYLGLYIPTKDEMEYILDTINPKYKFVKDGMPTKEQKDNQRIAVDEIVKQLGLSVLGDIGCNAKIFTKKIDPFSPNGIKFEHDKFHLMLSEYYSNEDAVNTGRHGCGEYYTLYVRPSESYPEIRYESVYNDSLYPVKLIK